MARGVLKLIDTCNAFFEIPAVDMLISVLIRGPLYVVMAALSLFQLRNLLTTIGQLAVMKPSKDTHPTIAQIFQFMKPSFQVLNSFIEEAFGGAGLPHLKTLTLNHYLVLSMVFAIFSLTAFFRETTNHRYRLAAESEQRPLSRKDKDE